MISLKEKKDLIKRIALLGAVLFFLFFRLGTPAIHEWDEARTGINAVEMLEHGHWRGLWFANAPDLTRNKPPLFIWIVAGSFHLFGYNTFALRFPSALATLGSLVFLFLLCRCYYSERFAGLVILVLLSVEGIAGYHTGRTGDFDALLTFFLMANTFYFLRYVTEGKERDLTFSTLLLAGAFLTKGPAMAVLLPGQALFLFIMKKWDLLNWKVITRQLVLFLLIPTIWLLFINEDEAPWRLIQTDILQRFTNPQFEAPRSPSRFTFLFVALDSFFNVWNYVLFLLLGLVLLLPKRLGFEWKWKENPLLIYSLACWLSLGGILSLVATTHRWYLAPAIPFVAISLVFLIEKLAKRRWVWGAFAVLLLFTLGRRGWEIAGPAVKVPAIIQNAGPILENAENLYYTGSFPSQRVLLYLYFAAPDLVVKPTLSDLPLIGKGDVIVAVKYGEDPGPMKVLYEDEAYWVLAKKE